MFGQLMQTQPCRAAILAILAVGSGEGVSVGIWVVGKLQVMLAESKAELWDSITYLAPLPEFA
jgi:hypothetical protein